MVLISALETRGTCGRGNLFTTIADIFSFFGFFIYPEDPECSRCQHSKHRPHVALPRDELSHIIEEAWDLSTFRHAGSWNVQLAQVRRPVSVSVSLKFRFILAVAIPGPSHA